MQFFTVLALLPYVRDFSRESETFVTAYPIGCYGFPEVLCGMKVCRIGEL